jgi:hypothetical protein
VFRTFDKDGDSYISTKDLLEKIKDHHMLTAKEQKILVEYLDPEKKGFLDFREFHSKIYSNVANSKQSTGELEFTSSLPTKEGHESIARSLPSIVKTRKKFSEPFDNSNAKLTPSTKFGSSPPFKNTIRSFCPGENTAFYCSEAERFDRSHNNRTYYQQLDKANQTHSMEKKIKFIQTYNKWFEDKVLMERKITEESNKRFLERKGKEQFLYEHVGYGFLIKKLLVFL